MKKIAALVETTRDRVPTVKSGSTVFRVPQQQRAVSAAEEFCIQIYVIKLAINPSKSNYHECVRGKYKEIFELFTNKQGRRPRMLNAGAEGVLDQ